MHHYNNEDRQYLFWSAVHPRPNGDGNVDGWCLCKVGEEYVVWQCMVDAKSGRIVSTYWGNYFTPVQFANEDERLHTALTLYRDKVNEKLGNHIHCARLNADAGEEQDDV